jgi:hypothetical protein
MIFFVILIFNALLFLFSPNLLADVLLIPTTEQNFDSYYAGCTQENSVCSTSLILNRIESAATPKYDQLIMDLQLESPEFTTALSSGIVEIVENEMISLDQLESLINILQRSEEVFKNRRNSLLRAELGQYLELIRRSPSVKNFEYIYLKKPMGKVPLTKLETLSFKPYSKKINFKGETIAGEILPFKKNRCSKSALSEIGSEYFSSYTYVFVEESNCSWTDSISEIFSNSKPTANSEQVVGSKYKFTSHEKNILVWSALAIGAGLFLSQFEFQIEY